MHEIDQGHSALDRLNRTWAQLQLADANEAETRLKVIDEVLTAVLGWSKEDVTVEERVSEDGGTTYADYVVRTATVQILIEAKKAGATFELPAKGKRPLRLGGVLSEGAVGLAIRQARDYCRKKSIPFAVVTNGNAWIIFPATRTDGVEFDQSDARVFRSLDLVESRFVEFWELLSRQRVLEGSLVNELLRTAPSQLEGRCVRDLYQEPGFRLGRNALYDHIEPAVHRALSDEAILNDPEALAACYVKTSDRIKYDKRIRMFLGDSIAPLAHSPTRLNPKGRSKFSDALVRTTAGAPPRFIVLLGKVGAGKSTFLHYTRKVSAAHTISGTIVWLHVDFKAATEADQPREFIYEKLLTLVESDDEFDLGDWEHSVRPAYRDEVERLQRGPLRPLYDQDRDAFELKISELVSKERDLRKPYVDRLLRHASGRRPGFLVIDNVDQIENDEFQGHVFLEAQALARASGFNVLIALRESTFLRHKNSPAFDAFQFDSFYLDAPSVLPVLSHRLAYAKRVLSGPARISTERGFTVNVEDLGVFFELVSRSLLSSEAGQMIEALAGGNVRRGLELVRDFLASGHTNADRALTAYLRQGVYDFPPHEIFRGCVLGASKYFDEKVSSLLNIYDAKTGARGSQLLRLKIVQFLVHRATSPGFDGIPTGELEEVVLQLGIARDVFAECMLNLFKNGFIQTSDGLAPVSTGRVMPTRLAGFVLRVLCRQFAYTEFCTFDTSILEDETWEELKDLTAETENESNLADRLEARGRRVALFLQYCARNEELWTVESKRRGLPSQFAEQIFGDLRQAVDADIAKALGSARRNYARPTSRSDSRTQVEDQETRMGVIQSSWPNRDYVFVRDAENEDWFAHKRDFLSSEHWDRRRTSGECEFLVGSWNGKLRATKVRVL